MRSLLMLAVVITGVSGCGTFGNKKVTCGWRFEVLKPPTISTDMPVIVHSGPSSLMAQPLGSAPVVGAVQAPVQAQCGPQALRSTAPAPTCEEICEMLRRELSRENLQIPPRRLPLKDPKEKE